MARIWRSLRQCGAQGAARAAGCRQGVASRKERLAERYARTPGESGYTAASIEVLEGLEPVRRRPGMYIGGTDEAALHHLFAEVLDNAMDEAVAGHASFIDVALRGLGLSRRDRQWARHSGRSASEISQEIGARSHHDDAARRRQIRSEAYQTSGGLHGVGISVVNALSERLEVEVARSQMLYRQSL